MPQPSPARSPPGSLIPFSYATTGRLSHTSNRRSHHAHFLFRQLPQLAFLSCTNARVRTPSIATQSYLLLYPPSAHSYTVVLHLSEHCQWKPRLCSHEESAKTTLLLSSSRASAIQLVPYILPNLTVNGATTGAGPSLGTIPYLQTSKPLFF